MSVNIVIIIIKILITKREYQQQIQIWQYLPIRGTEAFEESLMFNENTTAITFDTNRFIYKQSIISLR